MLGAAMGLAPASAPAQSVLDPLKNGTPSLQLRWGYESADLAGNDTDAASSLTMRTRLGYRTAPLPGETTIFWNLQDVRPTGIADYAPEDPAYDTIADPEGAALHEGYVQNRGLPGTEVRWGRQEIILDSHRLLGNVDWRQHGQSFDAFRVTNQSLAGTTLILARAWRVKTILNTELDLDALWIATGIYEGVAGQRISLYGIALDSPGDTEADRDLQTLGARWAGEAGIVSYEAEYAAQDGFADNDAAGGTMTNGFLAVTFIGIKAGVGYSELTGASGSTRAFDTLFSTGHAFNGWADQFLATNGGALANGLQDTYLQAGGKLGTVSWLARYHQFDQETTGDPYGTEVDLLLSMPVTTELTALVKLARYSADGGNDLESNTAADKAVTWARLEYRF